MKSVKKDAAFKEPAEGEVLYIGFKVEGLRFKGISNNPVF